MKTGGRRLAERWRWRKRVLGSSSEGEGSFKRRDLRISVATRSKHVNKNIEHKIASLFGLC